MAVIRVFRITRRWRFRFRFQPRSPYRLVSGATGTLRPAAWFHVGPYEVRVTMGGV